MPNRCIPTGLKLKNHSSHWGGIAGMKATASLADKNSNVVLIEKRASWEATRQNGAASR